MPLQIASGVLTTMLAQTRVLFDGQPVPLIYVQSGQVTAIVPDAVAGKTSTQLHVEYLGGKSNAITVPVAAAAPGIFSANSTGAGQGAILNQDNTYNSAANPAAPSTILQIFATGEGQTDPPATDGKIASGVLPKPVLPVRVTIGGQDAEVLYYGAAPGQVAGVLQVNARVPTSGVLPGAVPVILTVGSFSSQAGTTTTVK
ncbi:MAG: hypothetical protein LAQ69_44625 [Acidobacteriia bacterium]|nr:hypothetical protein [Terriglobia bacterium]